MTDNIRCGAAVPTHGVHPPPPFLSASPDVLRTHGKSLSDDPLPVRCAPGSDCFLRCTARFKPGVDYMALMWYKVSHHRTGAPEAFSRDGKVKAGFNGATKRVFDERLPANTNRLFSGRKCCRGGRVGSEAVVACWTSQAGVFFRRPTRAELVWLWLFSAHTLLNIETESTA